MILAARQATGTESLDPADAFVTDAEALAVLNGELAELYDLILENGFGDYYRSTATVTLASNKSLYSFATDFNITDFYEITSIDVLWSSTVTRSAKLFMEAERNRFKRLIPTWSQFTDVWYRPVGNSIEIQPTPQTGVSIQLNYVPQFAPLTDVESTFDSVNQWHWYAIWGLAAFIRQADDDEAGANLALQRKEQQRARVVSMAGRRVEGEPPRVQRSRRYDDEDFF